MCKQKKAPDNRGFLPIEGAVVTAPFLFVRALVVAAHNAQNVQQAGKQVEQRDVQGNGRHDVVGLAAIDDAAGFIQDQATHQQDEHGGNRQ